MRPKDLEGRQRGNDFRFGFAQLMLNLWGGTYTGSIHDQECVSCCHPGMCVQGSIGTHTIAQRSSCTNWAELLRLLNCTDQEVIFFLYYKAMELLHSRWNYWKKNPTHLYKHFCQSIMCIGSYLNSVHLCRWHHKVPSMESPVAESLGKRRQTHFLYAVNTLRFVHNETKLWT